MSPQDQRRFQFRLRTLLLAMTVLCIFLAVPAAAWALGFVTAYIALCIVAVGVIVCVQAPIFLLFQAMGWLPTGDRRSRDDGDAPP